MNDFTKSMLNLNEIEQLARRKGVVNQMSPVVKILVTLFYIVTVSSVGKYQLSWLFYLAVYPLIMVPLIDIPLRTFISKLMIPAIFSIALGLANPFFDREVILVLGKVTVTGGVLSMGVLFLKAVLSLSATLMLVATTSVMEIGEGMARLHIPKKLVMLLLLMYRYINVLLEETGKTMDAYRLRSGEKRIHISTWGSLVGQIIIRSYNRANEIYNAMRLRGYGAGDESL